MHHPTLTGDLIARLNEMTLIHERLVEVEALIERTRKRLKQELPGYYDRPLHRHLLKMQEYRAWLGKGLADLAWLIDDVTASTVQKQGEDILQHPACAEPGPEPAEVARLWVDDQS
jgi:hypothetical protein